MDQLGKKFKDYETPISVCAYKRLSMIYEKQGNYENAFEICIELLKMGLNMMVLNLVLKNELHA